METQQTTESRCLLMGGPERGRTGRVSVQGGNTTISQSLTYMVEETCKGGTILIEWVGGTKSHIEVTIRMKKIDNRILWI